MLENLGFTAIPAITAICYLVAQAVKATAVENKWLPVICGGVGAALGVAALFFMPDYAAPRLRRSRSASCRGSRQRAHIRQYGSWAVTKSDDSPQNRAQRKLQGGKPRPRRDFLSRDPLHGKPRRHGKEQCGLFFARNGWHIGALFRRREGNLAVGSGRQHRVALRREGISARRLPQRK